MRSILTFSKPAARTAAIGGAASPRRLAAGEGEQLRVAQRLDAERDALHAGRPQPRPVGRLARAGVRLERDLLDGGAVPSVDAAPTTRATGRR